MVGYLSEKVQCSELVRAFLDTFCGLGDILWCRTPGDGTVHDDMMERLAAAFLGNGGMGKLKMFTHGLGSGNGQRGKGGGGE